VPDDPGGLVVELADGSLDAARVRSLELRAEVVVLSACSSGRCFPRALGEPGGLLRAFLIAGARNVVSALWPVRDTAARDLALVLHRRLAAGDAPAAALAAAVRALRAAGAPLRDWAAWTLLGPGVEPVRRMP
jgi:CHAT domain-containing protein